LEPFCKCFVNGSFDLHITFFSGDAEHHSSDVAVSELGKYELIFLVERPLLQLTVGMGPSITVTIHDYVES